MEKNIQDIICEIESAAIKEGMRPNVDGVIVVDSIYPKTIYDEELSEGVTYLTKKDTDLSVDIIVDSGETYKYYNHPLCLFVVDNDTVHPVTISPNPSSNDGYLIPKDVIAFIEQNFITLIDFANLEIDGSVFFDSLREWSRRNPIEK